MNDVGLALIGAGGIAGAHLHNLKSIGGNRMVGICDIDEEKANKAAIAHDARPYTNWAEMLDREKPDGALLCTPAAVRRDIIVGCAQRGLPLFIEKPPADTLTQGHEIAVALAGKDWPHIVGFVFRWTAVVQAIKHAVGARPYHLIHSHYLCGMMLGDNLTRLSSAYYQRSESRGLIADQAIHLLDLFRYLLNEEVETIQALGANVMQPKSDKVQTEETVSLQFRTPRGVLVNHMHGWTFPRWQVGILAVGEGFHYQVDLAGQTLEGEVDGEPLQARQETALHVPEMEAFLDLIRDPTRRELILSDYDDAVRSMALVVAVNKALDAS